MKNYSATLQHRVRPLHPRLRVPTHWPTTPPCSANPFALCPGDLGSTRRPQVLAYTPPLPLSLQPPQVPLDRIQSP
jgi:hypothetical protein